MTRRGLPVGPPPPEVLDFPIEPAMEESPFLRPRRRTRVRTRRRAHATLALLALQILAVAVVAAVGAWTAWQRSHRTTAASGRVLSMPSLARS